MDCLQYVLLVSFVVDEMESVLTECVVWRGHAVVYGEAHRVLGNV